MRTLLATFALLSAVGPAFSPVGAAEEPLIGFTDRAFVIDGKPEVLLGGVVQYFRIPHELWYDRLLKARRAGMTFIQSYVPWNFHERYEGQWDFEGWRDLDAYLTLCEQMGFKVIIRPGPYICNEWYVGGFPPWLLGKEGLKLREYSQPFIKYNDIYLDRVMPIIRKHQRTRSNPEGCVVVVSVEDDVLHGEAQTELYMKYVEYLIEGSRDRGIVVPLNLFSDNDIVTGPLRRELVPLGQGGRRRGPWMSLEHHPFYAFSDIWHQWGGTFKQGVRGGRDVEYDSMSLWAGGAVGYSYFVFAGGTHFDYHAGGQPGVEYGAYTTSIDYNAPISEPGNLTEGYYAAKRVAFWAKAMEPILVAADMPEDVSGEFDGGRASLRRSPAGSILFFHNPNPRPALFRPRGDRFNLPEIRVDANTVHPVLLDHKLENGMEIKLAVPRIIDLRRLADGSYRAIVRGRAAPRAPEEPLRLAFPDGSTRELGIAYPEGDVPAEYKVDGLTVLAVNDLIASLTWLLEDDVVVFGPDFVRDFKLGSSGYEIDAEYHDVDGFPSEPRRQTVYAGATMLESKPIAPLPPVFPPPLGDWQSLAGSPEIEPEFDDSGWTETAAPADMLLKLGNYWYEYGWYRARIESPRAGKGAIRFSKIGDRIVLFVNGDRVGETAYHAETADFELDLKRGGNVVAVLANSLCITNHPAHWGPELGFLVMPKGVAGPVSVRLPGGSDYSDVCPWRFRQGLYGEMNGWYETGKGANPPWKSGPSAKPRRVVWYRTRFDVDSRFLQPSRPIMVRLDGMVKGDIWLNGHHLGRYWQIGPQRDYYMPCSWLTGKDNLLVLAEEYGDRADPARVSLINAWDREMNGDLHWSTGLENRQGYFYSKGR